MSNIPSSERKPARGLDDFDFARPREIKRLERRAAWLNRYGDWAVFAAALLAFIAVATYQVGSPWRVRLPVSVAVGLAILSVGLFDLNHKRRMLPWQIRKLRGEHESLTENKALPRSQRKSRRRRKKK